MAQASSDWKGVWSKTGPFLTHSTLTNSNSQTSGVSVKLFVGNLSFEVRDEDLRSAFEPFGQIESAAVVRERGSSQSRGFGFVEMPSRTEAQAAIEAMNGKELLGRTLSVNEARPMPERSGGGG